MDKRTVYGLICDSKNDRVCLAPCWDNRSKGDCPGGCEEYILARPSELAKVEAEVARVPGLEAAIAKKDEALRDAREGLWQENPATWEHEICAIDDALELTPKSVEASKQYLPHALIEALANLTDHLEGALHAVSYVRKANEGALPTIDQVRGILKPTEAEVEREQYARIGRAVEELMECQWGYLDKSLTLTELRQVIAKAREGDGNA